MRFFTQYYGKDCVIDEITNDGRHNYESTLLNLKIFLARYRLQVIVSYETLSMPHAANLGVDEARSVARRLKRR
jgi:hypothetical protein